MMVVYRGDPKTINVYDYSYVELFGLYRKNEDHEMQELVKLLRDRQSIPLKLSVK